MIKWHETGKKYYELGVSKGVLYKMNESGQYTPGVAWDGLTNFTESPGGAETTDIYADNIKYATIRSAETFGGTIEAYQSPVEFDECDGTTEVAPGVNIGQQDRKVFGFCYRTEIKNDTATAADDGYKLHLIYGCTASPSEKSFATINDSPEPTTLSWEITSTPVNVPGYKETSSMVIDTRKVDKTKLAQLEAILYGGTTTPASGASLYTDEDTLSDPVPEEVPARLPMPEEVIQLFSGSVA